MTARHFIFRWKDNGICVTPSRRPTEQEVWDYAAHNLIPAYNRPSHPMQWVRKHGQVIPDDE